MLASDADAVERLRLSWPNHFGQFDKTINNCVISLIAWRHNHNTLRAYTLPSPINGLIMPEICYSYCYIIKKNVAPTIATVHLMAYFFVLNIRLPGRDKNAWVWLCLHLLHDGEGGTCAAKRVFYNQLRVLFAFEVKNKSLMWGQIHLVGSHTQIICIGNAKDGRTYRGRDK